MASQSIRRTGYDFNIVYVNTTKFGNTDILSRLIDQHVKPEEDFVVASIITENDRMKAIARSFVYWPSIDSDIAAHVKACRHCAVAAKSPPKAPPLSWPKSTYPWQRVHIDYTGPIEGEYFLLSVDSYSKWVEIVRTKSITATATIGILRSLFVRLGMPETLVSDNGTQFTSAEFAQFYLENGINHVTTAPFHPQSNGQAERFVDTFKRAVKKIRDFNKVLFASLRSRT
ncbi:uncharacterized protein K02A2.6-like [Ochlerotatus camptorhynchus]|uniref:uncharacterized protein K02A2.6-like n=1 Tax=Ochlerotatus camptorhynchus TaxID=644619 RepID=UPI0031DED0A2